VEGEVALEAGAIDQLAHDGRPDDGQPALVDLDVVGVALEHHVQRVHEPLVAEVRQLGDAPRLGEHRVGGQGRLPFLVGREHGGGSGGRRRRCGCGRHDGPQEVLAREIASSRGAASSGRQMSRSGR